MTFVLIFLALCVLLLLVAVLDLAVFKHGERFIGPDSQPHWVRCNSWVNYLTGHEGLSLFRTTHVRSGSHETPHFPAFLAHEWRHLWQEDGANNAYPIGSWAMLWKHQTDQAFADRVEIDAGAYGEAHITDPYFVAMASRLKPLLGES